MSKFKNIECPALRAWNQLQYAMQLDESQGDGSSEQYFEGLSKEEKTNVMLLAARIAIRGRDSVQKEVMSYSKG